MWKQKGNLYPLQPKSVPLYLLYEVSIRGGEREIEVRVIDCLRNCASLLHRLCPPALPAVRCNRKSSVVQGVRCGACCLI